MSTFTPLQLAFGMPGPFEWTIILGIGLLIFGRRLPEVGKSLGKSIFEFKKGFPKASVNTKMPKRNCGRSKRISTTTSKILR